jgi:hypothetical protein
VHEHCFHSQPLSVTATNILSEKCCWCGEIRRTSMTLNTHAIVQQHGPHLPTYTVALT